jgi:hypothetical protein
MGRAGNVESVEQKGNAYRSLVDYHNERDELEGLGIGGRIKLKWI